MKKRDVLELLLIISIVIAPMAIMPTERRQAPAKKRSHPPTVTLDGLDEPNVGAEVNLTTGGKKSSSEPPLMTDEELQNISIGSNVPYRPGATVKPIRGKPKISFDDIGTTTPSVPTPPKAQTEANKRK